MTKPATKKTAKAVNKSLDKAEPPVVSSVSSESVAFLSPKWRFRDLYDKLGGSEAIVLHIKNAGYEPPPLMTVRGWGHRESIPSKWLLVLLIVALKGKAIPNVEWMDAR